ncbi:SGNH/GDSL hydrolase family protein [Longispora albida]|uniref:SGNH/GDSL hydrolase family protein n=1 Tax=Longispora albida TaxID=203523 RepID=UPI0004760BA3|nr:GDSL-type esterase/lipase family protein [Longispora albida]
MRRPLLALLTTLVLAACGTSAEGVDTPAATGVASPGPTAAPSSRPPKLPGGVVALGDSITRGMNACLVRFGDCPEASWSTGTFGGSHAQLVGQAGTNLAESGARVSDLADQVANAVPLKPAYVTVLIGANDACRNTTGQMTSAADFRRRLDTALTRLKQGAPGAKVLMVSIPDLQQLWQIGRADSTAVSRWDLGLCQAMLANPASDAPADQARRKTVRDRVIAYNAEIAGACKAYGSACKTDGGAVFRFAFKPEHVSAIDFFHPSAAGQAELARVTNASGYQW